MIDDYKPSLDELMHYGVKGMKWGVRKDPRKGIVKTAKKGMRKARNAYYVDPVKRERSNAVARRRTMSDKELNERIKRLEQEKKLKQLTAENISPGRQALKRFGNATLGAAGTAAGAAAVKYILGSKAEGTKFGDIRLIDVGMHVGKQLKKIKK